MNHFTLFFVQAHIQKKKNKKKKEEGKEEEKKKWTRRKTDKKGEEKRQKEGEREGGERRGGGGGRWRRREFLQIQQRVEQRSRESDRRFRKTKDGEHEIKLIILRYLFFIFSLSVVINKH